VNYASPGDRWYPDVYTCLGFQAPTSCQELQPHKGTSMALNRKDAHRRAQPHRALFRKRETEIHERIVQYTTIDADGTVQELIETQRSHNEVVHLECKESGEFVHRERLNIEQWETFNNEVVSEERGHEEYLHLKSKEDEYEHLDSNMPKKEEEPQAAPAMDREAPAEPLAYAEDTEMGETTDNIEKTFTTDAALDAEGPGIGLDISDGQWRAPSTEQESSGWMGQHPEEQQPGNCYTVVEPAPTPGTANSPMKVPIGEWENYMAANEELGPWKVTDDPDGDDLARSSFLLDPHPPPSPTDGPLSAYDKKDRASQNQRDSANIVLEREAQ